MYIGFKRFSDKHGWKKKRKIMEAEEIRGARWRRRWWCRQWWWKLNRRNKYEEAMLILKKIVLLSYIGISSINL